MKPICVPCQRFYRPKKNGFHFIEGMPTNERARPGTEDAIYWTRDKMWTGDLWECLGCGHQIISGVSREPIAEHYQPDFGEKVASYGADQFQVNDC